MKRKPVNSVCRTVLRGSILGAAFATPAAFAQTQQVSGEDTLDEVMVFATRAVTATKTDTPILNIPQSINIVTAEQIADRGANTLVEALNYTAGVSNGGDDSRGDFNNIRGFESVLYVDGLKRNYGFVYLPRPDVNALERIEVLVGPASVLYGSGSAGGLTNMQSKRPKFSSGATVSMSYGTFERKEAVVDVTGALSDTFAARFVGLARDSDSQIDFVPNDRVLLQPAITWKPGDDTQITAIALYQRDKNGPNYNVVPLVASILAPPGRRVPDSRMLGEPALNAGGHKESKSITLLADHRFSEMFNLHSATRYTKADTDQREIYPNVFADPLNPFIDENGNGTIESDETLVLRNLFAFDVDYETFNSDNNLGIDFATGGLSHKVLVGVDYSDFRQVARQAFGLSTPIDIYNPVYGLAPGPVYADPTKQVLEQIGYYVQDQVDFGEAASLVLGVRRDRYTKQDTGVPDEVTRKTTRRAGLTVNVTPTLAPFVSYSESFLPIAGLNQFGSTYSPLSGEQEEVGIKWQPLEATLLRVSYYRIKEDNALRPDPDNPLNAIQSGTTKSQGFEFQADHYITRDLTVTASYSHATSRQSGDGRQRDNVPKDLASIFGTKTMEIGDGLLVRFGGGVRYVGTQTSGDPAFFQIETPSYTLVDAMAALDYGSWALKLNALNLLDKRYYPTCYSFGFCANGLQRTVEATVAYRF
jgi:iron complex outermembrane receptor protein